MPSDIVRIGRDDVELKVGTSPVRLRNDAVIAQVGGTAPSELLAKLGVDVVTKYGER